MANRVVALVGFLLILGVCNGYTSHHNHHHNSHGKRADLFELSFIHFNDFHARFEEVNPHADRCERRDKDKCIGGLPRLASAIKYLLNRRRNAIVLNAGDNYQGTLWYNVHGWKAVVHFMNMLPVDVTTIGNHDFDGDIAGLVPFLQNVKAPVVLANVDAGHEPTLQGLTKKSTIIHRNGRKIGIIGVLISTTYKKSKTGKLKFLDEVDSVNREADYLKNKHGVDIIVVLSHCGLDVDRTIAAKCPHVDVIVGGHSHSFLYSGRQPFIDKIVDTYPVVVKQGSGRVVLIVQAKAFTKYLGDLRVWFDRKGEVIEWKGNPILLDHRVKPDSQVARALQPWKRTVDAVGNRVIGRVQKVLENRCGRSECNLANFVTNAMVDSWIHKRDNPNHWTYAAVAVIYPGSLRFSIGKHDNDRITFNDLITAMPFENTWDVVEVQGRDIIKTLEYSVASMSQDGKHGTAHFLHWAGLKATFNSKNPPNRRLVHVRIRCQRCAKPTYERIDLHQWYRIVGESFMVRRENGHRIIGNKHRNHVLGTANIDGLVRYMKKVSPVNQGREHRIIFQ